MTGLERLREFAAGIISITAVCDVTKAAYDREHTEVVGARLRDFLADIADQIEAEQEERVTRRLEDREAAEWVRKHNGIEYVKAHWEGRVARSHVEHMAERQRERRERMQRHIEFVQGKCRERQEHICELNKLKRAYVYALNGVCKRLGLTDGTGLPDMPEVIWAELDRRLMPEGMEWPRFEDGEPVSIGDLFAEHGGCENVADSVEVGDCWFKIHGFDGAVPRYSKRASVKRPEPKVLDADGVEIRVGDTVYALCDGTKHVVERIDGCSIKAGGMTFLVADKITHRAPVFAADGKPLCEKSIVFDKDTGEKLGVDTVDAENAACRRLEHGGAVVHCDPRTLTHERPVLDADGVPIREGDSVYDKCTGDRFEVSGFSNGFVVCYDVDSCESDIEIEPSWLTHTKPETADSWERLEEDAAGIERDCGGTWHKPDGSSVNVVDLVRRCRALAERERGE